MNQRQAWLALVALGAVAAGGSATPAAAQAAPPQSGQPVTSAATRDTETPTPAPRQGQANNRGYVVGKGGVARTRPAPTPADDGDPAAAGGGRGFYALPEVNEEVLARPAGDSAATSDRQAAPPAALPIGINEPGVNRARPPR